MTHPDTGQFMIGVAGLTQWGTRITAEFVTHEDTLSGALGSLPANWDKGNVQILLHCNVIRGTPSPAQIVAVKVW